MKRIRTILAIMILLLGILSACNGEEPTPTEELTTVPTEEPTEEPTEPPADTPRLILATTTSTQDSGLLDYILPDFEQEYGMEVDVVAVGTGQALELGEDGNADVLLVHARAREDAFMEAGHGIRREDVMYNDFVILGPADDPAGIRGMTDAAAALQTIAEAEAPFVSRGDDSGTHSKELSIWAAAEIAPEGDWYISAGQGMGAVLTMADEQQAYTLSDRATYLARTLEGTELEILVEGDPILFNPYGVMAVNPDKGPHIQGDLANTFIDWLVSLPTQELIATFGVEEFGAPLFTPDSTAWREAHGGGDEPVAALRLIGDVANPMAWSEGEVLGLEAVTIQTTNRDGQAVEYTGVPLSTLFELVGVADGATTVTFVADDGYTGQVTLAELEPCTDCIIAFREEGGFNVVMPGFPGNVQVKGVIEIQVE